MKSFFAALIMVCLTALPLLAANNGPWEIIRADYGSGNKWVDVTDRVQSLVQNDSLNFTVNSNTLGAASRQGRNRALRLQLQDNDGNNRQVTYRENQQVSLQVRNTYQGKLHINRAIYGRDNRTSDVTSRLNSQIQGNQLNMVVNNQNMGGDPAPDQVKTLTVQYAVNGQSRQMVLNEGATLQLSSSTNYGNLHINRAIYGRDNHTNDVTARLNSQIQGDQLSLLVNNQNMGGDPAHDQVKSLTVRYTVNGQNNQVVLNEGDTLRLPNSNNNYGNLRINRAIYGHDNRTHDVTSRLNSQIQDNRLSLRVSDENMGGDPSPGQGKILTVDYDLNGRGNHVVVKQDDTLRIPYNDDYSALEITRAVYGRDNRTRDVTSRLNSQIQNDQLSMRVSDDNMGGDPAPGQSKILTVQYDLNGRSNQVVVKQDDMLNLPSNGANNLIQRFRCESLQSDNYRRKFCTADTRGGIRLTRNLGNSDCTQGSTWGNDDRGVWVDKGCRAEFERTQSNWPGTSSSATIPNGTALSVRTNELIDSKTASVGQTFSSVIAEDVLDGNGRVIIPKGSDAQLVIRSTNGGGITSASDLVLDVDSITVQGTKYYISTSDLQRTGGRA